MMEITRVYTQNGRQRPIFLGHGAPLRFVLEVPDGAAAHVVVSHDPPELLARGKGEWCRFEGGAEGVVQGVSALRVVVDEVRGWVTLRTGTR